MRDAVAAYLDWWEEAGVLDAVGKEATNWFAHGNSGRGPASVARVAPVPPVSVPFKTPPRPAPADDPRARDLVAQAGTLDELHGLLKGFEGCGLRATAKNLCFYRGSPRARLMLIGEAPGRDEDLAGKPFVGRAGQLLNRMLSAIGLDESKVHIANTVYWRPPGNRTPTPEETAACAPFLTRQMELVDPSVVVLLGGVAAKSVLGLTDGILKLRGKWRSLAIAGREVRTLATLHPAYLLRTPAAKRQAWQDLLLIDAALRG